jgi:energy-coupling factor transport system substrate-specific component
MRSNLPSAGKLSTREICVLALMAALIFGTKVALAALPNVNLNSVLIVLTVVFFGWKSLYAVYIYVLLEGLVFGFSIWWFGYLYVWAILVIVAMFFRKNESALLWAVITGIYGLVFGLLMYLEYFAINGGWEMFFAMWVAGIPYDLTHGISNFVLTLVLYKPLYAVMKKLLNA